jgi:phosphopantothenoylcysteine decarboxylase/phosphopantothenate--cysteine ligase
MKTGRRKDKLNGKQIALGVTGSIAAYKACDLARMLVRAGAAVTPVMTENATRFVTPLTLSTLCGKRVIVGMFDTPESFDVEHVELARATDLLVVAPATANIIGKFAQAIADDFLTTCFLSTKSPVLIAPAMNWTMYENPGVRSNIRVLESRGCRFVHPEEGELACGEIGTGRLAELDVILDAAVRLIQRSTELAGKKGLVTAGPTREAIDAVRFVSNRSTGRMGYELAAAAAQCGAQVTLVTGPTHLFPPTGVDVTSVTTAEEMYRACKKLAPKMDFIVGAAAVADYAPAAVSEGKIKKTGDTLTIEFKRAPDIIAEIGTKKKKGQVVVGFAADTKNAVRNARKKLREKNLDLIVANDITSPDSGFAAETNKATLIDRAGKMVRLPLLSKREVADRVVDKIIALLCK